MLNGLKKAVNDITPLEFALKNGQKVKLKINNAIIHKPAVSESITPAPKVTAKFPKECRLRSTTYKGKIVVQLGWSVNNQIQLPLERSLGEIPIMVFKLQTDESINIR